MKDDLISSLADLQALHHKTEQAEHSILERALRMEQAVAASLKDAEAKARTGDPEAEARYQHLIVERGRLQLLIARSQAALAD